MALSENEFDTPDVEYDCYKNKLVEALAIYLLRNTQLPAKNFLVKPVWRPVPCDSDGCCNLDAFTKQCAVTETGLADVVISVATNALRHCACPGALQLSAQQRLFLQDETGTHMRSPITHTVPKSPLEPSMFTFKWPSSQSTLTRLGRNRTQIATASSALLFFGRFNEISAATVSFFQTHPL